MSDNPIVTDLMTTLKKVTSLQLRYLEIQRQFQEASSNGDLVKILDGLAAMADAAEKLSAELQETAKSSWNTVAVLAKAALTTPREMPS